MYNVNIIILHRYIYVYTCNIISHTHIYIYTYHVTSHHITSYHIYNITRSYNIRMLQPSRYRSGATTGMTLTVNHLKFARAQFLGIDVSKARVSTCPGALRPVLHYMHCHYGFFMVSLSFFRVRCGDISWYMGMMGDTSWYINGIPQHLQYHDRSMFMGISGNVTWSRVYGGSLYIKYSYSRRC